MNEVTKIHLGRQAFTISADAHRELRHYLDAIEKQVGDKEVVEEVELRMAELLVEHGISGDKVILPADVAVLKKQLGHPKDFKAEEDETAPTTASEGKRLFRRTDNAMIAGVASGLATYFGVDVLLIRILFVVGTIAWGGGILLYILLWLLVPEAKTSSERLQMVGKPVTINSLKEVVERADVKGAARRANRSVAEPINSIFNLLLKVAGIIVVISGLSAFFGLAVGAVYLLLHGSQVFQASVFPVGFREHMLLYIAMGVAGLMALFVVVLGVAMFRRKWPIHAWLTGVLIGLVFIGLAVGSALAADVVPRVHDRYNANVHTMTRSVEPFTSVNVVGKNVDIQYQLSSTYSVSFSYYDHPNLSQIKTTVVNGTLVIDSSQFDWHRHCANLCLPDTYNMIVTIYSPNSPDNLMPQPRPAIKPEPVYNQ